MKTCTCGESPYTGHYLWCSALRGQREYRPARPEAMSAEELAAVSRLAIAQGDTLADAAAKAVDGDTMALQIVCNVLNARARNDATND